MSVIEKTVTRMLGKTGLLHRLTVEMEQEKSAEHASLQAKKRAAKTIYLREIAIADAAHRAGEEKAEAARKAFDQAIAHLIVLSEKRDVVRDAFTAITEPADVAMLLCFPPVIDEFIAELRRLRTEGFDGVNLDRFNKRQQALIAAIDEGGRLRTNEDIEDYAAEIGRIRKSIPNA